MRLLKPQWVNHDERALFCVDIHPDGSRFATGGQGQDRTGTVCIWNMAPVSSERAELDSSVPRLLCRMSNHLGCVNCLRWSGDGKHLASGSDDKLAMIWQVTGPCRVAGSTAGEGTAESWRCVATLRGHGGDIFDLAWSPRDLYLATGSVDNLVIVWNASRWGEIVARLEGHTGLVKGVCWDPVGRFLCSQSDDRTLRVWRTADWKMEVSVKRPFSATAGTTALLRCNWSPDGRYIVSAHSVNNGGPTAAIVDRGNWRSDKDFVGHRKAVTCTRFCGSMLRSSRESAGDKKSRQQKQQQQSELHCACAVGSRDRGVSVWLTCLKRPLVVIHELFEDSVTDLSWHARLGWLAACSKDGTAAFFRFDESELGLCVPSGECAALHEKLYGGSATSVLAAPYMSSTTSAGVQLIESARLLQARAVAAAAASGDETTDSAKKPVLNGGAVASRARAAVTMATATKQTESRTSDGRRRITPMFLPIQDVIADGPAPFGSSSTDDQVSAPIAQENKSSADDPVTPSIHSSPSKLLENKMTAKSSVQYVDDKMDQDTPVTTTVQESASDGVERTEPDSVATTKPAPITERPAEEQPPAESTANSAETTKRKSDCMRSQRDTPTAKPPAKRGRPPLNRQPQPAPLSPPAASTSPPPPAAVPPQPLPMAARSQPVSSGVLVAPPAVQKRLSLRVCADDRVAVESGRADEVWSIEVDNVPVSRAVPVYRVTCSVLGTGTAAAATASRQLWSACLSAPVLCARVAAGRLLLACSDCCLHTLSLSTGRRLSPALSTANTPARLATRLHHVLLVTVSGHVHCWQLEEWRATVPAGVSIAPLLAPPLPLPDHQSVLTPPLRLVGCSLTAAGEPVVVTSDGKARLYSVPMACWVLLTDSRWPGSRSLNTAGAATSSAGKVSSHSPLSTITAQTRRVAPNSHALSSLTNGSAGCSQQLQQRTLADCTLAFLDTQVAAASFLQSTSEYGLWMCSLVRHLAVTGDELRLREICQDLLRPAHSPTALSSHWSSSKMGVGKRQLLRQLLPLMASNLSLQRLLTEIGEQLDETDLCI